MRRKNNTYKKTFVNVIPGTIATTVVSKKTFLLLLLLQFFSIIVLSQDKQYKEKIDPVFTALIQKEKSVNAPAKKRCWFNKKNRSAAASSDVIQYDCIVYTKNADALREKGIKVNSVLPTFVTASASLQQIQQMASMPEVTYVASPGENQLHNKSNSEKQ